MKENICKLQFENCTFESIRLCLKHIAYYRRSYGRRGREKRNRRLAPQISIGSSFTSQISDHGCQPDIY